MTPTPKEIVAHLDSLVEKNERIFAAALAIGVDDSKWDITIDHRGPVEKNGMVKVELEWQT